MIEKSWKRHSFVVNLLRTWFISLETDGFVIKFPDFFVFSPSKHLEIFGFWGKNCCKALSIAKPYHTAWTQIRTCVIRFGQHFFWVSLWCSATTEWTRSHSNATPLSAAWKRRNGECPASIICISVTHYIWEAISLPSLVFTVCIPFSQKFIC